jgi:hypothetical protein
VEQKARRRLAVVRLASPSGFRVDLLAESCGIEPEIVAMASPVEFEGAGAVAVAVAEDLLAMKVLAARAGRARDWDDARGLVQANANLDLALERSRLSLITERGFARGQDLLSKLSALLVELQSG